MASFEETVKNGMQVYEKWEVIKRYPNIYITISIKRIVPYFYGQRGFTNVHPNVSMAAGGILCCQFHVSDQSVSDRFGERRMTIYR